MTVIEELGLEDVSDGAVYSWSYKETNDPGPYGDYHCCSRIGIFQNGELHDTFWGFPESYGNSRKFGLDRMKDLKLKFLGNLRDYEKRSEYAEAYYDSEDVMNLNHSNSSRGNFYVRKSARRSERKMIEYVETKIKLAYWNKASAENDAERWIKTLGEIQKGKNLDEIHF